MSQNQHNSNVSAASHPARLRQPDAPSLGMSNSTSQPQTPTSPSAPAHRGQQQPIQHQRRRRSSGLSSIHDRSPIVPRGHRHRFSNASQDSFLALRDEASGEAGGEGMGNLADELDQMSDMSDFGEEAEAEAETAEATLGTATGAEANTAATTTSSSVIDGTRDSGIDVSYEESRRKIGSRGGGGKSSRGGVSAITDEHDDDDPDDRLSPDLEDLITTVARMAASTNYSSSSSAIQDSSTFDSTSTDAGGRINTSKPLDDDPLIPRTLALLQDLGNQSGLEASTQRLTTSTNSITANLTTQTKTLQSLSSTLYTPFGSSFFTPPDLTALSETLPLLETLLQSLPGHPPDTSPLTGLQKLDRDSASVITALSQLTDTLQMGKQATNAASRHLRTTEAMVIELRRERERADEAREELKEGVWEERVRERWCRDECKDILNGFEGFCEGLREGIVGRGEEAVGA